MDHSVRVGRGKCAGNLNTDFEQHGRCERSSGQLHQECVAAHILADDEEIPTMLFECKNGGNGRMREGGRNSSLALQSLAVPGIARVLRRENFDGNLAA